jgi:ATP-dependent Clp protease ATP-binding subunit ClpC
LKVAIEKYFRPEFLNRLDDVIVFHPLDKDNLKQIVDIERAKVRGRLKERGLALILSDESKEYIIDKGYNPDYGARPLRRAIENMIEDPLSEEILRGTFKGFDTLTVPVGSIAVVTVVAATAGAMAAVMPARRAAKLDVLKALVAE